jgi:NAD+ synthetase
MMTEQELASAVAFHKEELLIEIARTNGISPLIDRVSKYLTDNKITSVVLGVSGGVDSAVALAVLVEVQKRQNLNIFAEVIKFDTFDNVFENKYISILREKYDSVFWNRYDLSKAYEALIYCMNPPGLSVTKEVEANVTYALRYQAFFARAQQVGGITIGTTNQDELDYAGWFGKNSDMMTDVQFLWQYPKCAIRHFAKVLGVPKEIQDRVPVGDLIDGSSDEENFGVTYDELRWFVDELKTNGWIRVTKGPLVKFDKLIALHEKNAHKYATKEITHFNPVFI